jgi:hypothetical protein
MSALRRVADRLLHRHGAVPVRPGDEPAWEAEFFGLQRVAQYREADARERRGVLSECAAALLAESWFIERTGLVFCARMNLLAQDDDERRVYALIGADEAKHSAWLEPWIESREADPFGRFIAGLVECGGAQPLAYLLQVVLEGFGIAHYSRLAAHCRHPALGQALRRMAQDEALHHAAGLAAFGAGRLSVEERRFVAEGACAFLQMVRCGPQAVAAALEGQLAMDIRPSVFTDLEGQGVTVAKLDRLRRLMAQPGMAWLIDELDAKGVFTPCSAQQCAQIYRAT